MLLDFFLSSPHGAPPAQVGQLNGGLVYERGGAGRNARHRAAPSPSPHPAARCPAPAAQSACQP